jgi:hypothetical protein
MAELGFSHGLVVECDKCASIIQISINATDQSVVNALIDMAGKMKIVCQVCDGTDTSNRNIGYKLAQNPKVSKIQLESYQILMAEMGDERFDAHLEWEHVQNLRALLLLFGLNNDTLNKILANPNHATPSKGALWVTLSSELCKEISELLKDKVIE